MIEPLKKLLEHLETTVDPHRQTEIERLHRAALDWKTVPRLPLVISYPFPPDSPFQPFPRSQIYDHPEKMLFNELVYAFENSICLHDSVDDDLPYTIRADFGTGLIASLFGGRLEQVEENPPWIRCFETRSQFERALDRDPSDGSQGWGPRVRDRYRFYQEVLAGYPQLKNTLHIVMPDLQGPFDTAEQLGGGDTFVYLYEAPGLMETALQTIARAQVALARDLLPCLQDGPAGYTHQHNVMIPGNILIRNDSSIMISPPMYRTQVAPFDQFILREMAGGGIHSCGCFEAHLENYLSLPSLTCLDCGQSWLNDMDDMYRRAQKKKIPLLRLRASEQELVTGEICRRFPTGVTLTHQAPSRTRARQIAAAYRRATEKL